MNAEVLAGVERLFRGEYPAMHRLAFTMLRLEREAEEVVHDAFAAIMMRDVVALAPLSVEAGRAA
jgi:DNA-directed RNA polymerase specialized sigma24 family protein